MGIKQELEARAKDIDFMVPYWDKVDAIVEGHDAVRAAGKAFLPMFPAETEDDYTFRLSVGKFTNVYRDVVEGLSSKPFENEVTILGKNVPDTITKLMENVDGSGSNLTMFSALTFFNGINNAIDWIFVDYPTVKSEKPLSIADAEKMNLKPYWSHVLAKNVREVRTEVINSKEVLSYIRIFEPAMNTTPNRFRVFERTGSIVNWTLYREEKNDYVIDDQGVLSIDVIPLVPFATGRRDGKSFKFFPVMRDAVDLQVTLYQNESALEFIKTMAGYPMLAANGMKPQMGSDGKTPMKVAIGPMKVLYGVPDGAGNHGEWKFIEPNANCMEFLQKNIDKTKQDLRELGRQPLTALSSQLTTVTTSIAAGKAKSAVTAWALGLKDALENALVITAKWMKLNDYDPEVNVYTGFDNVLDDGSDLTELGKARERGDLSLETYWSELKRRKVLSPEFEAEDEKTKILDEIPNGDNPLDSPTITTEKL